MKVLIDNVAFEMNNGYELDSKGQIVKYHEVYNCIPPIGENLKYITNKHVYVFFYNANKYKPCFPLTYSEYIKGTNKKIADSIGELLEEIENTHPEILAE